LSNECATKVETDRCNGLKQTFCMFLVCHDAYIRGVPVITARKHPRPRACGPETAKKIGSLYFGFYLCELILRTNTMAPVILDNKNVLYLIFAALLLSLLFFATETLKRSTGDAEQPKTSSGRCKQYAPDAVYLAPKEYFTMRKPIIHAGGEMYNIPFGITLMRVGFFL
jgi:hypothetical protein